MKARKLFSTAAFTMLALSVSTLSLVGCDDKKPDGTPTKAGEAKQAMNKAADATKEAAGKAGEAMKEAAVKTADATKEAVHNTAEKVAAATAPAGAAAPKATDKKYTIGVVAKSQSNSVFQAARTGAVDAGAELSKSLGVNIDVQWRTPNNEDAQQQAQFIEQLVAGGADGIAVSCSDAKVLTSAINAAVDKGVQVVTFDSDAPESKRFAYYGIDDLEAGKVVGRELAKAMGDKGVVAIKANCAPCSATR